MIVGMDWNSEQTIVFDSLAILGLLRMDHPDEPDIHQGANGCWFVSQNEHIDGVAIFRFGRRDETEIKRKIQSLRKDIGQFEKPARLIELVFPAAVLRRLDDAGALEGIAIQLGRQTGDI